MLSKLPAAAEGCSAACLVFGRTALAVSNCSSSTGAPSSSMNATRTPADGGWCDQNLPTFEGFVQIVAGKGDVRNNSDNLGHVAMRLEPDPLDPVGTGLKTGDVNLEGRDMTLPSTGLCVWNPDMVVPPSELRYHGRRLMVQSLSASHGSLH